MAKEKAGAARKAPAKAASKPGPKKAAAKPVKKPAKATTSSRGITSRPAKKAKTVTVKAKTAKAPATARKPLTAEREREIRLVVMKMKKTPTLTFKFVSAKWRDHLRTKARVEQIPKYQTALTENMTKTTAEMEEQKQAKFLGHYKRKMERLSAIVKAWEENPYHLKPDQELLLSKMRLRKPMSSYMRYAKTVREEIQKANPTADFGTIGKLIGDRWRSLTDEEKAKFGTPSTKAKKPTKKSVSSSSSSSSAEAQTEVAVA
jgi:hypothetical protein